MMRGNGSICLFCRHTLSLETSFTRTKRFASTRHREPYILPRLVIDLDAADSKYVRKADELPEWNPIKSAKRENWRAVSKARKKSTTFNTSQVTPPDLLAFALMGDPGPQWTRSTLHLRDIYRYRKIQADDSIYSKALRMTSDFKFNAEERLGFDKEKRRNYVGQLLYRAKIGGFHELAQTVFLFSTTKEGCLFLAGAGDLLFNAIGICRRNQKYDRARSLVSTDMVLHLYNDLRINMDSKGVEFGPLLSSSGLYYASKCWNLPSIRTYLELLSKTPATPERTYKSNMISRWLTYSISRTFKVFVMRLLYEPEKAQYLGSESLKLITGWADSTTMATSDRAPASFMYCLHTTPMASACTAYLAGLAELGLKDTLEAEWMANSKNAIGKYVWRHNSRTHREVFALAFHLAGNSDHALNVLKSRLHNDEADDASYSDIIDPDEQTPEPIQSSEVPEQVLETSPLGDNNDNSTHFLSKPRDGNTVSDPPGLPRRVHILRSFFHAHYQYHHLVAAESLEVALTEALIKSPEDPKEFLDVAEKFFIRDYRAPPIGPTETNKELQWIDQAGVQGLCVHEKGEVVHWKPASKEVVLKDTVVDSAAVN